MKNSYEIYIDKLNFFEKQLDILLDTQRSYKHSKTKENKKKLNEAVIKKNTAFLEVLEALIVLNSEEVKND